MAWKVGKGSNYTALYSLLMSATCHTKRNPQSKIVQSQTYLYCSDSSSSSVRHGSECPHTLPCYFDRVNFWFINGLDLVIDFSWFNLAPINTQSKPNQYPTTTAIGDEETFEVKLLYSLPFTLYSLLTTLYSLPITLYSLLHRRDVEFDAERGVGSGDVDGCLFAKEESHSLTDIFQADAGALLIFGGGGMGWDGVFGNEGEVLAFLVE